MHNSQKLASAHIYIKITLLKHSLTTAILIPAIDFDMAWRWVHSVHMCQY